jgi:beta-N-acetylhexosaminidase
LLLAAAFLTTFPAFAKAPSAHSHPLQVSREGEQWAEQTLHRLTLQQKVGQLFMVWVRAEFLNVDNPSYVELRDQIRKYHVGSLAMTVPWDPPFLNRSEPYEAAELLNRLQRASPLPLLVAADFERGVPMRLKGATVFPHAMAFGAAGRLDYAEAFGRITGEEARAIGVHWNFFPDADVNSNPANPVINTRSFGEDPEQVGDLVAAYIRGAHSAGMMTTAKHFPGHGDTSTDSHLGVAQVSGNSDRLNSIEIPPFRKAIEAGVDAVMVAHVTVPALEPDPSRVATTSSLIVGDLLKKQLGFNGIVVTDALDMEGLTRLYAAQPGRAAVDAFKAGNDLLIIPLDLDAAYKAMLAAANTGEISRARIDASVLKILRAKAAIGLYRSRTVDLSALPHVVGKPENLALGQQVADGAVTLVRDNGKVLPLKSSGTNPTPSPYQALEPVIGGNLVIVFSDDVRTDSGRGFERQMKARAPQTNVIYVDSRIASPMSAQVLDAVAQAQTVIAAIYAVPVPGKPIAVGESAPVAISDAGNKLLEQVLDRAAAKTIVVAMGNPYLAQDFPGIQNYLCAFSNSTVSEISAVKALFGEISISGHLPVNIPNIAPRGAGIQRRASVAKE